VARSLCVRRADRPERTANDRAIRGILTLDEGRFLVPAINMPAPARFLVERRRHFSEAKARRLAREIILKLERAGIHRGTPQSPPAAATFTWTSSRAKRGKEPSSWAGLGLALSALGLHVGDEALTYIATMGVCVCGLASLVLSEGE
jgi:hypothetical protein